MREICAEMGRAAADQTSTERHFINVHTTRRTVSRTWAHRLSSIRFTSPSFAPCQQKCTILADACARATRSAFDFDHTRTHTVCLRRSSSRRRLYGKQSRKLHHIVTASRRRLCLSACAHLSQIAAAATRRRNQSELIIHTYAHTHVYDISRLDEAEER